MTVNDFTSTDRAVDLLRPPRIYVDQPYIQAATAIEGEETSDRLYVGNNNNTPNRDNAAPYNVATVDVSVDANRSQPVARKVDQRLTTPDSSNESGIRTAIHASGVIYAVFYSIRHLGHASQVDTVDVMVVRDDRWAKGPSKYFEDLTQSSGEIGRSVAGNVALPVTPHLLGSNRLVGSHLSVAVNPNDAGIVYVAWADYVETGSGGEPIYTLHLKKSIDSAKSWLPELLTVPNGINPALAVNANGKVGFLYQQLIHLTGDSSWETHLRRSPDGNSSWSDDTLSTFLESGMPRDLNDEFYMGDYLHLMAVGKDFYGVFSASNYPDSANFPEGVTYQRNADFDARHRLWDTTLNGDTIVVTPSIDPFFFHVTELDPSEDFFVRDFTESSTYYDEGLEPSTSPRFSITSDIWNRRTNTPGPYRDNGAVCTEPRVIGDNFIFTRVRRKGPAPAGSADKTVSLNYYCAQFGAGNNFVPIGSSTLSFSPSETDKTTSGIHWSLPTGSSNQVCLGVEISTDKDPLIGTTLDHHVPGGSTGTNLLIINDNNRAQRNTHLYVAPDPPVEKRVTSASAMTMPPTAVMYALIHNPALETTDIQLETVINSFTKVRPSLAVIARKGEYSVDKKNRFVLHNMKPGESRFLKISYPVPPARTGKSFSLTFNEIKNGGRVNAFTILHKYFSIDETIKENVRFNALIFTQVIASYKTINTVSLVKRIDANDLEKNISSEAYLNYLKENLPLMKLVTRELISIEGDDLFGLLSAANILEQQLKYKNVIKIANAHLSFLNTIDAYLTFQQLEKGNIADILQTMYLQSLVAHKISSQNKDTSLGHLIELSDAFISGFEKRTLTIDDYPGQLKNMISDLKDLAVRFGKTDDRLMSSLKTMELKTDPAELQGAHIKFLLVLKELIKQK